MKEFTSEVYDLWVRYASKSFRCVEEQVSVAIAIAWFLFTRHGEKYSAKSYIRFAVAHVHEGRDIPGLQTFNQPDALDHTGGRGETWMAELRDRHPGPERIAEGRDDVEALYKGATADETIMFDMIMAGYERPEIAETLGCQPKTVSNMKRRIRER